MTVAGIVMCMYAGICTAGALMWKLEVFQRAIVGAIAVTAFLVGTMATNGDLS